MALWMLATVHLEGKLTQKPSDQTCSPRVGAYKYIDQTAFEGQSSAGTPPIRTTPQRTHRVGSGAMLCRRHPFLSHSPEAANPMYVLS